MKKDAFPPAPEENGAGVFKGEKPSDSYVQSLAKGLAVINSFNADNSSQTLTQVAQNTGLTVAGARRILLTLEKLGYVYAKGRNFELAPKVLNLGFSYLSAMPFGKLAQPFLEELTASTGENASISVLDGHEIVYVMRVPTSKIMATNIAIGTRLPAYCTAMGRVLLAGLPDEKCLEILQRTPLVSYTPQTVVEIPALMDIIRQCRAQGWASIYRELDEVLLSISVPIRNRQGEWIAAMNISNFAYKDTEEGFRARFLDHLLEAAQRISGMLV